jgi:hypothetical protein
MEGMMHLRMLGTILALACFAGVAMADDDDRDDHDGLAEQCHDSCHDQCKANGGANCNRFCQSYCRQDVSAPQQAFKGKVTSTPIACTTAPTNNLDSTSAPLACASSAASNACASITGTVANPAFRGGDVTIWIICPAGTPYLSPNEVTTTTKLASTPSDPVTGAFTFPEVTGACGGQTGCYGLLAVTPPRSTVPINSNSTPDPNWTSCTNGVSCPNP